MSFRSVFSSSLIARRDLFHLTDSDSHEEWSSAKAGCWLVQGHESVRCEVQDVSFTDLIQRPLFLCSYMSSIPTSSHIKALLRLKHNLVFQVNTKHTSWGAPARSAGTQGFEVSSDKKGDILSQLILLEWTKQLSGLSAEEKLWCDVYHKLSTWRKCLYHWPCNTFFKYDFHKRCV